MDKVEAYLFERMEKAKARKNELELEFMIAEQEYQALRAAYQAYKQHIDAKTA